MGKPTIVQLREQVRGDVVTPDDAGYEDARKVYNAMIDRRPGVVVRPANVEDVVAAVNFARESGLDLAVRGGGHSVPGFGTVDEGVVIDLSRMRGVRVDPENQRARAEGGATWGDFNTATHEFGPGDHGRHRLDDGRGRAHARRRYRLPGAGIRPVLRQPGFG
jgi:FAD/FMN-containing dehydrogenase